MTLQHFTTADGIDLAFRDEGEGLPLFALPGLTRHGGDFDFLKPHLPSGIRLIRPDYRGRGASEWAHSSTYSVPIEAGDVIALMVHLGIERAAFLGTSRGGILSMALAAGQKDRVIGVCLNDIGPVIDEAGLAEIAKYIGRETAAQSWEELAAGRARTAVGFDNVPEGRWLADVKNLFREKPGGGFEINYDPALRDAFLAALEAGNADLWPLFDALEGLPIALIHGLGSDLLTAETVAEMRRRRPDMGYAPVAGRGHIPWLDEPEALPVILDWLKACGA